jgi:hypothetical protein
MLDLRDYKIFAKFFAILVVIFIFGCNNKEYITIQDKNITKEPLPCLGLDPMNLQFANDALSDIYNFDKSCHYRISITTRGHIHCNSSFNSSTKANSAFPTAYVRLELKDGMNTAFSYYVDLTSPPDNSDIKRAFEVMREYILLPKK